MKIIDRDILPEELPELEAREIYSDINQSSGRRKEAGAILKYRLPIIMLHEGLTIPFKKVVRYVKSYHNKAA